jgi:hypothetical protein
MVVAELKLDDQVQAWIESETGSHLVHANRIPGGGTREGWFIDVKSGAGTQNLLGAAPLE